MSGNSTGLLVPLALVLGQVWKMPRTAIARPLLPPPTWRVRDMPRLK
jgi:hypothetical protein